MTEAVNDRIAGPFNGDGTTVVFPYDFKVLSAAELQVIARAADGTDLVLSTGYSVSGVGDAGGGNVTFVVAPVAGSMVILQGVTPIQQPTTYTETGRFPAASHEAALDQRTRENQELKRESDRAAKSPVGVAGPVFPAPGADGTFLGWAAGKLANLVGLTLGALLVHATWLAVFLRPVYAILEVTPEVYGAAGDLTSVDTTAVRAAFAAGQLLGRPVIVNGKYKIDDLITMNLDSGPMVVAGHGQFLRIANRGGGADGLFKFTRASASEFDGEKLRLQGFKVTASGITAGVGIELNYTSSAGALVYGAEIFDVGFESADNASWFHTAIKTVAVSMLRSRNVFLKGCGANGYGTWTYGWHDTGTNNESDHWHTNLSIYCFNTAVLYDGLTEGLYFIGCDVAFCQNGIAVKPASAQPDVKFQSTYVNAELVAIDIDNIAGLSINDTSVSSTSTGKGNFIGFRYAQSAGDFISTAYFNGFRIYGTGGYAGYGFTETGMSFLAGNQIYMGENFGYLLDVGIVVAVHANISFDFGHWRWITVTTRFNIPAALGLVVPTPRQAIKVNAAGTQVIATSTLTKIVWDTVHEIEGPTGQLASNGIVTQGSYYHVKAKVGISGTFAVGQTVYISIFLGASEISRVERIVEGNSAFMVLAIDDIIKTNGIDSLFIYVWQTSGVNATAVADFQRRQFAVAAVAG